MKNLMNSSVATALELVSQIQPEDEIETAHRDDAIAWLKSTDDVFRRVEPKTPPKHLVSYVVVVDPTDLNVFLFDHVIAGLWLPPGGHVEPDEHPSETARRELAEELGIAADFSVFGDAPLFLTVTETVSTDHPHVDVSFWYVATTGQQASMTVDHREFNDSRWWTTNEIARTPGERFDPHFHRFIAKLHSVA